MTVEFKIRLRQALELREMRAVDLVEKTGIPKGAISYYLAGRSQPKADRLYIIAQALNVSEAWLLGYDTPIHRSDAQKKNDQLAKLIVKMKTDADFFETVAALADLTEVQYRGIKQLMAAFEK
jgi:transcriptional regulator with XRE-family HTH domain